MKGDFSRYTFNKKKHYNGVLMQQGRVQLDADWNEQQAIDRYRTEIQGKDVIGPCGAPRDNPGFKITWSGGNQLNIGKGHYYVDGILAENENPVDYDKQPDFPTPPDIQKLIKKNGDVGLVYLDVWQRHITSLDNPYLREKALDGPDTTTRLKTVWQVKVLPLSAITISNPKGLEENFLAWQELEAKLKGAVNETTIKNIRSKQIEVEHKIIDLVPMLHCGGEITEWSKEIAPSTGKLNAHTTKSDKDEGPCLLPPLAGYKRLENQLYRVEIHKGGPRNVATFKWSRDNASIVTEIIKINGAEVEVSDVGKDKVLEFANDQWVEITDDKTELSGQPGQLIQIVDVNYATKIIKLKKSPTPVDMTLHPKLRRWDHVKQSGASVTENGIGMGAANAWIPLEDGIEVQFSTGSYKTGDYWLIPGRTATGEIEWPPYEVPNKNPIAQPPLGIKHHFCRLALVFKYLRKFYVFEDCRRLFPPVTELTNLFYISGDGQEAMPGDDLPKPLVVGVSNGQWPVAGARIRFEIIEDSGQLKDIGTDGCVMTGADGTARCNWQLGNAKRSQQVKATLLGAGDKTLHIPIIFTANLSKADQVAYNPIDCARLAGKNTVQEAIDELCKTAGGGGCAVSVGEKGGEYPNLPIALDELLNKQTDICICLLPGEHNLRELPEGLQIKGPEDNKDVYVKITGCGPGTRIYLKKPMQVSSLGSFVLRDVTIIFDNSPDATMQCTRCSEVTLESCSLTGITKDRMLLSIEGADHVRLKKNIFSAFQIRSFNKSLNVFRDTGPEANRLFMVLNPRRFNLEAGRFVKKVSGFPYEKRKDSAGKIMAAVDRLGDDLSNAEKNIYVSFANALAPPRRANVDELYLLAITKKIRAVSQITLPGKAVVIMDEDADVIFESNDISGMVSFYGMHDKEELIDVDLQKLEEYIKVGQVKILGSTGRLQAQNNRFTRLLVADNLIKKIKEIIELEQPKGELTGIFKQFFLTDNLIETFQNQFITEHLSMMSNLFEFGDRVARRTAIIAGTAITDTAVLVGNQAANNVKLQNASRDRQLAANLPADLV